MNDNQPRHGDEPASPDIELARSSPSATHSTEVIVEEPGNRAAYADSSEPGRPDEALAPAPARVVTINRSLFLAMVTFGALAILALGAATTWLALDRGDGEPEDPIVATVNGEPIRRSEYDKAVALSSGEDVLDQLVTERLIATEARKRNIVVDDAETAQLLDEQKQQFGNESAFQAALAQAGLTEEDFLRQLRLGTMLRRMVADRVQVSDQEVNDMYQATADRYVGVSETEAKGEIREGIQRQRENTAARELLDQLRTGAQIETHLPGKS